MEIRAWQREIGKEFVCDISHVTKHVTYPTTFLIVVWEPCEITMF